MNGEMSMSSLTNNVTNDKTDGVSRGVVNYTSRDYESIMKDFWDLVPKISELWKPEADADPGVVLGKFLASVADMLGVNTDWLANELFAPSVSQRKNAEKIFGLIGYDLGWYTAARTEVTIKNTSDSMMKIDFGFNGSNFSTLNAYTDITNQSRVITYNVLPMTNVYGTQDSRSTRSLITDNIDIFADTDLVTLAPGESATRVAIEGELRWASYSVDTIKKQNLVVSLPSQHVDTTAVWVKSRQSSATGAFDGIQWIQCTSPADFVAPEPRFAVTYDAYSNAQLQISNYLNQLENYSDNWLTVYWIDCSGVIGCVGENALSNLLMAKAAYSDVNQFSEAGGDIAIYNLANTLELPHTNVVTGKSPETAKEAYINSRKYINTFDSLVTLPDFNRFLNREPGVDCGVVLDCQKALEINLSIYNNKNLTASQKAKLYITNQDFPAGDPIFNWASVLDLGFNPEDPNKYIFAANFKRYTAMCFAVHNGFKNSSWGQGQIASSQVNSSAVFTHYRPPKQFIAHVIEDYRPLQAMTVELGFGWLRVFPFYIVGEIYPKRPVSIDVGENIISNVNKALAVYFDPANRQIGQKPTVMEVVKVIQSADSRIDYFDSGNLRNPVINYTQCDIDYFNAISIARYVPASSGSTIRIAPEYIAN